MARPIDAAHHVRFSGYVEKLFVAEQGARVRKGRARTALAPQGEGKPGLEVHTWASLSPFANPVTGTRPGPRRAC